MNAMFVENVLGILDISSSEDDGSPKKKKTSSPKTPGASPGTKRKAASQAEQSLRAKERHEAKRKKRDDQEATERKRVYVGIDLGTTGTGVAYVTSNIDKPPESILSWSKGAFQEKTPSIMAYANENDEFGDEDRWGTHVHAGDRSYAWWKLLLDASVDPTAFDDPLLAKVLGSEMLKLPRGKTAQAVATDFLRFVYLHLMAHFKHVIGRGLAFTPLTFCITVPATWSLAARNATREAALDAGMLGRAIDTELVVVDEPQAAILDTLLSSLNGLDKDGEQFEPGSSVLACDLGGGTIDSIVYCIKQIDPTLKIEEGCVGDGRKTGATSIDRAFWNWCETIFGAAFTEIPLPRRATGSLFMNSFEAFKIAFSGAHCEDQEEEMFIPLRMEKVDMRDVACANRYSKVDGTIMITSQELEVMFEPVLKSAFGLVRDQVAKNKKASMPAIKTLVLCGGLSNNPFVRFRFGKFVKKAFGGYMDIIYPERPSSAIARGAAIHARDRRIVSFRRSRHWIGVAVHKAFYDKFNTLDERMVVDGVKGFRARNQMEWSVERGQKIYYSTKSIISCFVQLSNDDLEDGCVKNVDLYVSSSDSLPRRLDDTCSKIAVLQMNLLSSAEKLRKELEKESGKEQDTYRLTVKLELSPGSDKGIMEVRGVTGLRTVVGYVKVVFESDSTAIKVERDS